MRVAPKGCSMRVRRQGKDTVGVNTGQLTSFRAERKKNEEKLVEAKCKYENPRGGNRKAQKGQLETCWRHVPLAVTPCLKDCGPDWRKWPPFCCDQLSGGRLWVGLLSITTWANTHSVLYMNTYTHCVYHENVSAVRMCVCACAHAHYWLCFSEEL